jgi:hypothetical protein
MWGKKVSMMIYLELTMVRFLNIKKMSDSEQEIEHLDLPVYNVELRPPHDYYVIDKNGKETRVYTSVTALVGCVFPFDKDEASQRVAANLINKPSYDHHGLKKRGLINFKLPYDQLISEAKIVVQAEWNLNGVEGTCAHEMMEAWSLHKTYYAGDKYNKEFEFGVQFLADEEAKGFVMCKGGCEIRLFDGDLHTKYHQPTGPKSKGVCGSVDGILENVKTRQYKIIDWKRTAKAKPGPWKLQLGLYHLLLGKRNFEPVEFVICQFHPGFGDDEVVDKSKPAPVYQKVHRFTVEECDKLVQDEMFPETEDDEDSDNSDEEEKEEVTRKRPRPDEDKTETDTTRRKL